VTPHGVAKFLVTRDGPNAPAVIHGSTGLKVHLIDKANAKADLMEKPIRAA
jgi:hypothetical protein